MTPNIRAFAQTDHAAAVTLFHELNHHESGISGDRKTDRATAELCVEEMIEALASHADMTALVAEMGGVLAGLMVWAAHLDDTFIEEEFRRYGRVEDIVVAAAFRGQGVGQALLAEAERLTREAGMARLRLSVLSGNDQALDAYGRFGFRDYARVMVKDLG
jgi:ribosomal protein S18 acetylase RimI-like enzyme